MFGMMGGIIQSAASHVNAGINYHAQKAFNKQARAWQTEDYDKMRRDSLNDWNMQNQYNSPAAQMERYKAAGLNPNLIYGQSNESGAIRATTMPGNNAQSPQFEERNAPDWGNLLMQLESREITNDNARKTGNLLEIEANKKAAEILKILSETDKNKLQSIGLDYDNTLKGLLLPHQYDAAVLKNQNLQASTDLMHAQTDRTVQATKIDLREIENKERGTEIQFKNYLNNVKRLALEKIRTDAYAAKTKTEIDNIRQRTKNLEKSFEILTSDAVIKKWHAELAELGINPNDDIVERQIAEAIEENEVSGIGIWEVIKRKLTGAKNPKGLKRTTITHKQGNKTIHKTEQTNQ